MDQRIKSPVFVVVLSENLTDFPLSVNIPSKEMRDRTRQKKIFMLSPLARDRKYLKME